METPNTYTTDHIFRESLLRNILESLKRLQTTAAMSIPQQESGHANGDYVINYPNIGLFGVFDSVGSLKNEDSSTPEPAQLAAELIHLLITNARVQGTPISCEYLQNIVKKISRHIVTKYKSARETTVAILVEESLEQDPNRHQKIYIVNAGDSRAYLFRNGQLRHLTLDQARGGTLTFPIEESNQRFEQEQLDGSFATLSAKELLEEQLLLAEANSGTELKNYINSQSQGSTIERIKATKMFELFMTRNWVRNCIGNKKTPVEPTVTELIVLPGDLIVITSDGVHDNLKESQITQIISEGNLMNPHNLAGALIYGASLVSKDPNNDNPRASQDDMSVFIKRY